MGELAQRGVVLLKTRRTTPTRIPHIGINYFYRVVVEEVKQADAEVPVPTSEVRLVGEAPSTFSS